jgi:hypothetical protein
VLRLRLYFRLPNSGCRPTGRDAQTSYQRCGLSVSPHSRWGDGEPGSINICRLCCSSPVHFREPLTIMHGARPIGNATIGPRSRRGKSALVGVKLMHDLSACWRMLLARADPTENKRRAQSIISYSPLPRFFDFNTFNARIINGSTPFSISVFLLSSLMSTGTPLPS